MLLVLFPYLTFKTLNFIYFTPHIPFMSTEKISEGKANCYIYTASKISKELPVFYNPVMKFNRDTSVLLLKCFERKFSICDPLAGTGIRGIRFLLELKNVEVDMNDISEESVKLIKKNLKLNMQLNLQVPGVHQLVEAELSFLNQISSAYLRALIFPKHLLWEKVRGQLH